jgi:polyhydroxyalkanoate synthesis regulator protein
MAGKLPEVLIKRYGGSRLYDTATVSLTDLADMLANGRRFTVVEAGTGEDITREVLGRLH